MMRPYFSSLSTFLFLGYQQSLNQSYAFQVPLKTFALKQHIIAEKTYVTTASSARPSNLRLYHLPEDDQECHHDLNHDLSSYTRREAFKSASKVIISSATLLTAMADDTHALNLNPFVPPDQVSTGATYQPAKRATAYLVDSTIPPTLVPYRASREAAVLKNIGNGLGTSKTPYIEESVNLNNMMNKGVFGAIDLVKGILQISDDDGQTDKKKKGYDASFVFMGVDYKDQSDTILAVDLMSEILKPRRGRDTALALEFVPMSMQPLMNQYLSSSQPDAETILVDALVTNGKISRKMAEDQLPLFQFAKSRQLSLIACKPEPGDIDVVRMEGLQNVDEGRRVEYVMDTQGFIEWTQNPKNRMYAEKSLLKDFEPMNEKDTSGNFFAERILVHEAMASAIARYAVRHPKTLIVAIAPIADVRFFGGANGRLERVCKKLNPGMNIDEASVTTILLNPSAEETLSQSRFLRLEIGTKPELLQYQTKVADYLWFSSMPKVNMLPRLMNGS